MDEIKWLEVAINTTPERLDEITAKLTAAGMTGLVIEDEAEFQQFLEQNRQYWDYVDQELMERMRGVTRVKFYVTDDADGRTQLERYTRGPLERSELEKIAADSNSVEGRLVLDALNSPLEDEASLKEMIQVKAREEFVMLQAGPPLLDMIVMIAPMFGILGTASGLVQIFSVFGMDESHGMIAQGIAQALNTTIAGLAIATPAVIAHVYYSRKLERISASMEVLLTELISFRCHPSQH